GPGLLGRLLREGAPLLLLLVDLLRHAGLRERADLRPVGVQRDLRVLAGQEVGEALLDLLGLGGREDEHAGLTPQDVANGVEDLGLVRRLGGLRGRDERRRQRARQPEADQQSLHVSSTSRKGITRTGGTDERNTKKGPGKVPGPWDEDAARRGSVRPYHQVLRLDRQVPRARSSG